MAIVSTRTVSGIDLLVLRKTAGLRQEDVASVMGVARSRIAALEAQYRPASTAVKRYVNAVEQATSQ